MLVSFSLYGTNPFYTKGAIENAKLMPIIYPGWTMRVYHGVEVPMDVIQALRSLGCQLYLMPHEYCGRIVAAQMQGGKAISRFGQFWRFLAADNPIDKYAIFRDCDSRINVREKAAVEEWIASGMALHTMKDHQFHIYSPILAGMWGVKTGAINIELLFTEWKFNGDWYDDQKFLEVKVWPILKSSHIRHGIEGKPFPPHPPYPAHVGQRVDQNNNLI